MLSLEGGPGRFTARVLQQPRYIDTTKCTSCGECSKVCPVTLPNEYDEGLSEKRAAYKRYAQAIPGAFAVHKADKAPCRLACPAGLNVQGYVQMVKEAKYKEALEIIMQDLPLPGVLGRICPHGCEDACRRCEVDQPVAIRDLKRLAADRVDPRGIEIACAPRRGERVAIIGSGPAGLSCAYHLARRGIGATIFEALPQAGGMLRVGIPAHRLPRKVLDQEIEVITNLGVEIKTNTALGRDVTIDGLLAEGYRSVYLALGAHKGIALGIPGEKTEGVRQGVDFLREANLEGTTRVGRKVAIIGGGNVAIDVSRSAVRLGAEEVSIVYRRTRDEMPAWEEEIRAAEAEGVAITYLAAPQEVLTRDGRVVGLRLIRMHLTEPDSSGRKRPVPVPGSEFEIECDQLIPAIGQRPDLSSLEEVSGLTFSRWGTAEVNAVTYATEREGVFAGGDLQTGPWVAIGAVAAGKEAAESIARYIDGRDMAAGREPLVNENPRYRPIPAGEPKRERARMPELAVAERRGNFEEVELGYEEAAGRAEAARCINCGYCSECMQCVGACLANAVDHHQQPSIRDIEVGSVIMSPGSEPFDPSVLTNVYPYQSSPNVVTSLEFERLLSASGPTMGHLVRPSDRKEPKKIAWLQCVGSRDINRSGNGYCSSVCCMYAIKDAMIAKEHAHGNLDCAIFYMDIRTFGKDYEKYYHRAKDKAGVRFVNARVHSIDETGADQDLRLRYIDDNGNLREEEFDMVVLSVGLQVHPETRALAERLGVEIDRYRFAVSKPFEAVTTSRPGVFACGVFQAPKDIPGSVTEASAAACLAGRMLSGARNTLSRQVERPAEIDVSGEEPRVGVFVCNCGVNIAGVVDVKAVEEYARTLPNVVFSGQNLFTCSQDSQEQMKKVIEEHRLNRVVVAACSPKTHEGIFMDTLEGTGRNKYLLEMANIRNQDSWVHSSTPDKATAKAKQLVAMGAARAATLNPLAEKVIPVNPRALVIGGGVAGMNAALAVADQGFEVVLVEKEDRLGGMANRLHATIEGWDVQRYLQELIAPRPVPPPRPGPDPFAGRRLRRVQGQLHHGGPGGTGHVRAQDRPRGRDHRHRRRRASARGIPLRSEPARGHPGGAGRPAASARRPGPRPGGHDPVRGFAQRDQPQLLPGLLSERGQKRDQDQGSQPGGPGLHPLPRHPHLWAARGLLPAGAPEGGALLPLRNRRPAAGRSLRGRGAGDLPRPHHRPGARGGGRPADAFRRHRGKRHRGARLPGQAGPHPGGAFHGGACQAAAGRHGHRGALHLRHRPQPPAHPRVDQSVLCGGGTRNHVPVAGAADALGRDGQGDRRPVRLLPDLRALLPLRRAEDQRRGGERDRRGPLPRLRHLRGRVPGQGHRAQLVRGRSAAVQGGHAARGGHLKAEFGRWNLKEEGGIRKGEGGILNRNRNAE